MHCPHRLALVGFLLLSLAAQGQKRLSDYELQNAEIGPESVIEITPGSNYQAQVMMPNPDGPLSPLAPQVVWTIAPSVKGVNVDSRSGLIQVDKDVPNGTTANVRANIEAGRRILKARLAVFTRENNPFVGEWIVAALVGCADGHEVKPDPALPVAMARDHLRFRSDGQFWIGLEMNIAAHTTLYGPYEYDLKAGTITLKPKWPANKPVQTWSFQQSDQGRRMAVKTPAAQDSQGLVCGYVYRLR